MIDSTVVFLLLSLLTLILAKKLAQRSLLTNLAISALAPGIGILLGPHFLNVVDAKLILNFDVLISLSLGIVGFVLGVQFKQVKNKFTEEIYPFIAKFLLVVLAVGASLILTAQFFKIDSASAMLFDIPVPFFGQEASIQATQSIVWLALILALSAMTSVYVLDRSYLFRFQLSKNLKDRIFELKVVSCYIPLFLLGFLLANFRGVSSAGQLGLSIAEWSLIAGLSGIVCGIIFTLFLGQAKDDGDRIYLATIGAILLASGIGQSLGISSLFVNFIFGVTVALTSKSSHLVRKEVSRLMAPAYIMILLLVGFNFNPTIGAYFLFVPCYIFARYIFIKTFIRNPKSDPLVAENPFTKPIGKLFFIQDIFPLALALSFYQTDRLLGEKIISIVVVSLLLTMWWGYKEATEYLTDCSLFKGEDISTEKIQETQLKEEPT